MSCRTEGQRWAPTPKDLPHGLHRRCHPRAPLRRLRLLREHHRVPAGAQERAHPPGTSVEALRRQRCQLPLAPARRRVRQARDCAHPRSPLAASGKGENRALLQNAPRRLARNASTPMPPRTSRRSTAASGPGSRASTTNRPIAASTGAPRSSSGRSQAKTCVTPVPTSTSTTCSSSRPNAAS